MKYLILGSAGQIGTHMCALLRQHGDIAIEYDLENTPQQDLRQPSKLLLERMQEADFVIFLAFDVGGARYLKTYQNTYEFVSNNVKIMDNVFEALKATKKPFIFASTQMSNMSYSSYGVLKALGEYYAKSLKGIVIKLWNVYGVEHNAEKWHAITDFIHKAQVKKQIELMTDGKEMRQLLFADDACEALYTLSKHENYSSIPSDANLHITSFEWVRIIDVAAIVGNQMNVSVIPGQSEDTVQKDLRNEPDRFILKYWQPKTTLKDGISQVIRAMTIS